MLIISLIPCKNIDGLLHMSEPDADIIKIKKLVQTNLHKLFSSPEIDTAILPTATLQRSAPAFCPYRFA